MPHFGALINEAGLDAVSASNPAVLPLPGGVAPGPPRVRNKCPKVGHLFFACYLRLSTGNLITWPPAAWPAWPPWGVWPTLAATHAFHRASRAAWDGELGCIAQPPSFAQSLDEYFWPYFHLHRQISEIRSRQGMASIPRFQAFHQSLGQLGHWPVVPARHAGSYGPAEVRYSHHQDHIDVWGASRSRANARRLITTTTTTGGPRLRPDGGGAGGWKASMASSSGGSGRCQSPALAQA